jgi:phospholipase C
VIIVNGTLGSPTVPVNRTLSNDKTYLSQANQTKSIEDLLLHSSVSWKYYDYTLGSYATAIKIRLNSAGTQIVSTGLAYNPWNPQAAKAESYNTSFVQHFAVNTQFYSDAKNGTLPNLSWVIPAAQDSDHPGQNSTLAQTWLASIVNAVEASPEWNTTALYITWDDYGGFYDSVAPPVYDGQQLAFRVPLLVISPYTRVGAVTGTMGYFESVLHLMEWRFHLGCIAVLDCNAPLPIYGFNWSQTPRAPLQFPTNFSQAKYPYNPAWNGTSRVRVGGYVPPLNYTYFPDGEGPDID